MSELLKIENLYKSYITPAEEIKVLRGVNLTVNEGESVAIVGHSGSGKSTLLHLIGGLDKFQKGEIYFKNTPLSRFSQLQLAEYRKNNVGFVFQFHYLLTNFTVIENILIPAFIRCKSNKNDIIKKAWELLNFLGILEKKDKYPSQLSGGEQQRVAIARALINEPDLLLADEPTGNLDEENRKNVLKLLLKINEKQNKAMIIVTHDMEIAMKMNKVYKLKNGKLHIIR